MSDRQPGESKKLVSRREFLVGGGAVIAALALAACGTKTSSTTTIPTSGTSTSTQQTTNTTSTSTLTPKYGGTITYISGTMTINSGWPAEPKSIRWLPRPCAILY